VIVNYGKVDNVIRNIIFTINALKTANNQLESEISRLSNCKGTTENPHDHSSEIASIRKTIDNNEEKIKKLEIIYNGLSNFKSDVFKKDIDLSRLFENNDLLEKIIQMVIPPYKCPYEDEQMSKDTIGYTQSNIVPYNIEDIHLQNGGEEYSGWIGCYGTSMNNMWRVNQGATGAKIADLSDNVYGTLTDSGIRSEYTDKLGNTYKSIKYTGGNGKYKCDRISGLSIEDYDRLIRQEIDAGRIVCVRVLYEENQDIADGHTLNIVGINYKGEYLYANCASSSENSKKPTTLRDSFYYNSNGKLVTYCETPSNKCEIIIDTTD